MLLDLPSKYWLYPSVGQNSKGHAGSAPFISSEERLSGGLFNGVNGCDWWKGYARQRRVGQVQDCRSPWAWSDLVGLLIKLHFIVWYFFIRKAFSLITPKVIFDCSMVVILGTCTGTWTVLKYRFQVLVLVLETRVLVLVLAQVATFILASSWQIFAKKKSSKLTYFMEGHA